jgi:endonuclease/exonuclease/phosphatase family metal-dependent hydrolase
MWRSSRSALALAAALCALASAAEPCRVAVLSYNIHAGIGVDGKHDIARIAGVIRGVTPDLVSLQEVDRRTKRSAGRDLAEELARATGLQAAFGKAMDYAGGEYGVAALARGKIVTADTHGIEPSPGQEPRVILDVTAEVPSCGAVRLLATHFDNRTAADRMRGARLANTLARAAALPALLAGDLNATPEAEEIRELAAEWSVAGAGLNLLTIPVAEPSRQIDYILFRPARRWRVVEAKVLDERVASDHRPVFAVLELTR